jgi:3-methyladenine DNA glycosylase/8-oxoguanine DNA glycosylase
MSFNHSNEKNPVKSHKSMSSTLSSTTPFSFSMPSDTRISKDPQSINKLRSQRKEEMRRDAIRHLKLKEKAAEEKKNKESEPTHFSLQPEITPRLNHVDEENYEPNGNEKNALIFTKTTFEQCIAAIREPNASHSFIQLEPKSKV